MSKRTDAAKAMGRAFEGIHGRRPVPQSDDEARAEAIRQEMAKRDAERDRRA